MSATALRRYWDAREEPARVFLFGRALLCVLAFDCWSQHLPRAARYGVDAFNVPHFAFLEWLPQPTAALYATVLTLSGFLAFGAAFLRRNFALRVNLLALYSYGWAMSLLDGYQHHYFLSWLLFCSLFFPRSFERPLARDAADNAGSYGYVMVSLLVATVYLFAAVAKLHGLLRGESAFERLLAVSGEAPLSRAFEQLGLSLGEHARTIEWATAFCEVMVACAILFARVRGTPQSRLTLALRGFGGVLALGLHVGSEALSLQIGWFSAYMLLFTATAFAPSSIVSHASRALNRLLRIVETGVPRRPSTLQLMVGAVGCAGYATWVLMDLGLPGARDSSQLIALVNLGIFSVSLALSKRRAGLSALLVTAASIGAFALTLALTHVRARYDAERDADRALRAAARSVGSEPAVRGSRSVRVFQETVSSPP